MKGDRLSGAFKLPWGIFAGINAMICSFITIGLIAIFVISSMMIANVGADDGLSQSWWLVWLYIGEGITVEGFLISLWLYLLKKNKQQDIKLFAAIEEIKNAETSLGEQTKNGVGEDMADNINSEHIVSEDSSSEGKM